MSDGRKTGVNCGQKGLDTNETLKWLLYNDMTTPEQGQNIISLKYHFAEYWHVRESIQYAIAFMLYIWSR